MTHDEALQRFATSWARIDSDARAMAGAALADHAEALEIRCGQARAAAEHHALGGMAFRNGQMGSAARALGELCADLARIDLPDPEET